MGGSEAILKTGVTELVNRPHGAQDVPLAGVLKESHEMRGSVPLPGELDRGEGRRPDLRESRPDHQPAREPEPHSDRERDR